MYVYVYIYINASPHVIDEPWMSEDGRRVGGGSKSLDSAHPCPVPTLTQFMLNNASVCMFMGL